MQTKVYRSLLIFVFMSIFHQAMAVKAYPGLIAVRQPDGSSLSIRLQGDEHSHYRTTSDNYMIIEDKKGFYRYATRTNAGIVAGTYTAHNKEERTTEETAFLKTIDQKKLRKSFQTQLTSSVMRSSSSYQTIPLGKRLMSRQLQSASTSTARRSSPLSAKTLNELVILVNYSDTVFTISSPQQAFYNLFNQPGYSVNGGTGSVHDFYSDNTLGLLSFNYTVVGPVTLPNPMSYYGKGNNVAYMLTDACQLISPSVDFSSFDNDGDGYVDCVFIVFAGHNAAEGGPSNSVWPCEWTLTDAGLSIPTYNGVKVNTFACNSELKGDITSKQISPIGTFCHEFGHTLGLLDLYDVDYTGTGTEAPGMANWDLMSSGNYNNNGNTPPYLCAVNRWMLGWSNPTMLTSAQTDTLQPIGDSNQIYRINLPTANEFYLLENRQLKSWDNYLDGHGMLITHVDKTTLTPWINNELNVNPAHQYVDLVEANGSELLTASAIAGDPFPGTAGKTAFTDASYPTMGSWYTTADICQPITNITENNYISFDFCGGTNGGLTAPTATKGTEVSDTSFVANWETASSSSIEYMLDVYTYNEITETENFTGFLTQTDADGWRGNYALSTVTYSSSPCAIVLNTSKDTLISKTYSSAIKSVSFWAMSDSSTSGASVKVEAYNGSSWQTVEQAIALSTAPETITLSATSSPALPEGTVQLRFTFSGNSGNIYLDDVSTTHIGKDYLTNYQNINMGNGSLCSVHPVINNTPYFYVVRAQNSIYLSPNSNEIEVIPIKGRNSVLAEAYANQGNLIVEATTINGSNTLKVYTVTGQIILAENIVNGTTTITDLPKHALYIVVVNGRSFKVVL
jgi:M6 family metalloprotease-like protein